MSNLGNQAWRPGQWAAMALAGLLGPGLLSACDDKPRPPETPPAAATDISAHARRVAVEKIGAGVRNPAAARFRGVQVYQQADPSVIAVCGQVNPDGREDQAFIPFVSVVTYARRPDAGAPEFDIEQFVATSTSEATRMYIEMTSRCGENGGPRQVGNRKVVPPLPPLPSDLPDQIQPPRPIGTFHAPASQTALPSAPVPGPKAEFDRRVFVRRECHHAPGREHPYRSGRRKPARSRRPERRCPEGVRPGARWLAPGRRGSTRGMGPLKPRGEPVTGKAA